MRFLERISYTLYRQDVVDEAFEFICRRFYDCQLKGINELEVVVQGKRRVFKLDGGKYLEAYVKEGPPNIEREPISACDTILLADQMLKDMKLAEGEEKEDLPILEEVENCSTRLKNIVRKGLGIMKVGTGCTTSQFLKFYYNEERFLLIPGCGAGSCVEFKKAIGAWQH